MKVTHKELSGTNSHRILSCAGGHRQRCTLDLVYHKCSRTMSVDPWRACHSLWFLVQSRQILHMAPPLSCELALGMCAATLRSLLHGIKCHGMKHWNVIACAFTNLDVISALITQGADPREGTVACGEHRNCFARYNNTSAGLQSGPYTPWTVCLFTPFWIHHIYHHLERNADVSLSWNVFTVALPSLLRSVKEGQVERVHTIVGLVEGVILCQLQRALYITVFCICW